MSIFRRFTGNSLGEASVMELIKMDVIMNDEFDLFNITKADVCNIDDETEVTETATEPKNTKGGTVLIETVRRIRILLPITESNLSNCIKKSVYNSLCAE